MLTFEDLLFIIDSIEYKDWQFVLGGNIERPFLQIQFHAKDNSELWPDEENHLQYCRKWQLSKHMCKSEVIRTAWKAVLAAEEHEAAEKFRYNGVDLFNPHLDLVKLAELRKIIGVDVRQPLNQAHG
jgi:hypothetical protein